MSHVSDNHTINPSVNSIEAELEKPFLFQNQTTNKASSIPLSTRQLCRILCPITMDKPMSSATRMMIQSDSTLLIGFDATTGEYSQDGWCTARNIPVLREACCNWYYEGEQDGDKTNGSNSNVRGPISCRELSRLYENRNVGNVDSVKDSTRVWSPEISQQQQQQQIQQNKTEEHSSGNEWKYIKEFHHLRIAMESFVEAPMPWSFEKEEEEGDLRTTNSLSSIPTETIETQKQNQESALEEFLASTADDDDKDDEEYESDGGTIYAKDHRTGNWIHADLLPRKKRKLIDKKCSESNIAGESALREKCNVIIDNKASKKKKKSKFKSKNAKCWIYVTNLPKEITEEELIKYFSKVGIIDLDPETQKPKVKLYRYRQRDDVKNESGQNYPAKVGSLKGDASICYARPESVDLAIQLLDDTNIRPLVSNTSNKEVLGTISVQRAKFTQHGDQYHRTREISNAKRKVARLAALQAIGWDEGENGRITGGLKGLRIIVLKGMFTLEELERASTTLDGCNKNGEDAFLKKLEEGVLNECKQLGLEVEKITVFSKNVDGVMVVKFTQPTAASKAIETYNGRVSKEHGGRKLDAYFWDGVTDFTVRDEAKEHLESEKRIDKFGDWLDEQEVPDEFSLKVEE